MWKTIDKECIVSCPVCDSYNFTKVRSSYDNRNHIVTWRCIKCETEWLEEYHMVGAVIIKERGKE